MARSEPDMEIVVLKDDLRNGMAKTKDRCGIAVAGARVMNVETFKVGYDDSGDELMPWAAWDQYDGEYEDGTPVHRHYTGDLQPKGLANLIITLNDADRAGIERKIKQWPENGKTLYLVNVESRVKQSPDRPSSRPISPPERKVPRKPRRSHRRIPG